MADRRTSRTRSRPQLASLESGAFAHVVRTRAPVLRSGDRTPSRSARVMHAPIELGPRLYGVLSVGARGARTGSARTTSSCSSKLARSSAAAIANAIDFQRERRIARALTLGFVPESLPQAARLRDRAALRARRRRATGGDVYGAWQLPSGEVALLVGDVAGKGVETAALSAMVRFFIEARSWDSLSPAQVLEQANAMLIGRLPSDTFVTAFLGVLTQRLAALRERRPPAAAAPVAATALRAARAATGCRSGSTDDPPLRARPSSSSRPATSCSPTPTA